jgi:hypothetical protein
MLALAIVRGSLLRIQNKMCTLSDQQNVISSLAVGAQRDRREGGAY